jgi:hypothetical protein
MIQPAMSHVFPHHRIEPLRSRFEAPNEPTVTEELLPFTVRLVRNEDDLNKAVHIRHSAYARHMPEFAEKLRSPEPADNENDVVVLLAESKLDGSPLGTARIQTNQYRPLSMEESVNLPPWIKRKSLADIRRLGIVQGTIGRLVKIVLIKACFQYCERNNIDWAVIAARPPLDRSYQQLMFEDILPGETFTPAPSANNVPHRVMAFEIETGEARWTQAKHPMLKFFCNIHHPDIDVTTPPTIDRTHMIVERSRWASATAT